MRLFSDINILSLGEYFYKLAECSQDVFWVRDRDFKTQLYVSPAFEKIWGMKCDSLYEDTESWFNLIHPDDRPAIEQEVAEVRACPQGNNYNFEYRIIRPDFGMRWIQESGFPLFDSTNQLLAYAGVAKDITYGKQRLAELERATHFFRIFAEKIQQAVFWVHDPYSNKQIYVSPSYEKIWGKSCESLYENPAAWIETLVEEDRDLFSDQMRINHLIEKGPDVKYEDRFRIRNAKGEMIWIKDTSFPFYDEHSNFIGFAGIAEDVTKEMLHEKELREAKLRAEVANQAKSDFLAMVSHELRTPLNAILGMAQILHSRGLSDDLKEYVNIISNAGNNLLALVNDILDFVKLEAGKLSFFQQPFNLQDLITQIMQSMQYLAKEKTLSLHLHYVESIPTEVIGDQNRIRQILVNLLSNAIKFTEQGQITISVSGTKKTKKSWVFKVTVKDTGIGIQKDKLEYIFEKFNQINSIYYRKHQGLGLGLTITKELVERMGGKIRVKSIFGKGSVFQFKLPLELKNTQPGYSEAITSSGPETQPFPQFNLKILLVEDNIINQKIAKAMLNDFGCEVDIASNGQEVLNDLTALDAYQLIFMDVGLPDMSGFDIVRQLRAEPYLEKIPIVAITAHILERDRQHAFSCGMNKIIGKPISYEEIAIVLSEVACLYD